LGPGINTKKNRVANHSRVSCVVCSMRRLPFLGHQGQTLFPRWLFARFEKMW
jgi:hypothetical protein